MAAFDTIDEFTKNAETLTNLNSRTFEQASRKAAEYSSNLLNQKDWDGIFKTQTTFLTESSNLALEYSRELLNLVTKPFTAWNKCMTDAQKKAPEKK